MEIAKHGIALPETEDTNFIYIAAAKQEIHCTAGLKRASEDILWIDAGITWYGEGCRAEETCNCGGQNRTPAS